MSIKTKEILNYLAIGILFSCGGFYFAFAKTKPFAALPEAAVNQGTHFDAAISFQWSAIPVVLGCLALIIGGSFLLAAVINLLSLHKSKMVYTIYHRVLDTYRLPLAAVLAGVLYYLSVVEGFAALTGTYLGLLWDLPMKNILRAIGIVEVQLAILVATETAFLLAGSNVPEKLYRISSWCLFIFSVIGISANTLTNPWFILQSGFALFLFWLYTTLIERHALKLEAEVLEILEETDLLDEIGL